MTPLVLTCVLPSLFLSGSLNAVCSSAVVSRERRAKRNNIFILFYYISLKICFFGRIWRKKSDAFIRRAVAGWLAAGDRVRETRYSSGKQFLFAFPNVLGRRKKKAGFGSNSCAGDFFFVCESSASFLRGLWLRFGPFIHV